MFNMRKGSGLPSRELSRESRALVIGAGVGGLASALSLASRGWRVDVFEAGPRAGGKLNVATVEGLEVDTGPSLLTMPDVFEGLFAEAGTQLADEVELIEHDINFRYLFADGASLDVYFDVEHTLDNIGATFGARARDEFGGFLNYARQIWEAAAPNFVYGPAPSIGSMFKLGLTKLGEVRRIDPMRSMRKAIFEQVSEPHLRMLLMRYATYNGSNALTAPATLNCIAHVELALGGYSIKGGMYALVRALERVARQKGVRFHFDTLVQNVVVEEGHVKGLILKNGERILGEAVVANADVYHVVHDLLPHDTQHGLEPATEWSMSAWNAIARASFAGDKPTPSHPSATDRPQARARVAHTVIFAEDYEAEFRDIFEKRRPPQNPTIYICAQHRAHQRACWDDAEPLFLMANAPAVDFDGAHYAPHRQTTPKDPGSFPRSERYAQLRDSVVERLRRMGLLGPDDRIIWERTPPHLAAQFPGSHGSIYGAASNSQTAAFRRPSNRVRSLPGLYLASGSAHPGGGVPMCALSGIAAANEVSEK